MLPTLKPGQDVLAWCWFNKYRVGDIVVIRKNSKEIVKRIQKIDGPSIFVIGDNLRKSTDSRHFGLVDRKQIIGKVILM